LTVPAERIYHFEIAEAGHIATGSYQEARILSGRFEFEAPVVVQQTRTILQNDGGPAKDMAPVHAFAFMVAGRN
jgi:hypothetical protein